MNSEIKKIISISGILTVLFTLTIVHAFADADFTSSFDNMGRLLKK